MAKKFSGGKAPGPRGEGRGRRLGKEREEERRGKERRGEGKGRGKGGAPKGKFVYGPPSSYLRHCLAVTF